MFGFSINLYLHKGTRQKLLSGFFPLRGGGYPAFPLSFFEHIDFPFRGGGVPPLSVKGFWQNDFPLRG